MTEHNGAALRKDDPYVFPCVHKNLASLPPVYQAVCGLDPVRDDATVLKHVLDAQKFVFPIDYSRAVRC